MCTVHHITKYYFAEKNSEDCVRNHPHTSQSLFTTSLCHNNTNHHAIASSEFIDLTRGRVYYYRISVEGGDSNCSIASFLSCILLVISEFITVMNMLTPMTVKNPSRIILMTVLHILQRVHCIVHQLYILVSYTVD
nr:hypothetical protein [uncultured Mediterranean phage uvMED]